RHTINEIARLRARQARRRLDFTHKLTHDMAYSHGFVGIEDLRVKNMTASAKGTVETPGIDVAQQSWLNRGILDNAPGERRRQLAYKCPKLGSDLRPVPPFHTSNTCPNPECGKVDPANRLGCGREFACVHCGFQDHADHVASVNIFRLAEAQGPIEPDLQDKEKVLNQQHRPPDRRTTARAGASQVRAKRPKAVP
ncbi:IS605 family transposase OrfB, partial [mine drainage metagenome]